MEMILDPPPLGDASKARLSLGKQLEHHRQDPSCTSCYKKTDPIGKSFNHYEQLGQYISINQGAKLGDK